MLYISIFICVFTTIYICFIYYYFTTTIHFPGAHFMENNTQVTKEDLLSEAKTITEGLINNFDEFYRFNKNTFHENYYSTIESLIAQIEPSHFTKRHPAFLKISEQAFSNIHQLQEYCNTEELYDISALIHTIKHIHTDEMHQLVTQMENLAILVYNKKSLLTKQGYTENEFFSLLTIIASVRKEFSEKKKQENEQDFHRKITVLQKELKRIKVAAKIIFAQRPARLQQFTLDGHSSNEPRPHHRQQVDFSSAM